MDSLLHARKIDADKTSWAMVLLSRHLGGPMTKVKQPLSHQPYGNITSTLELRTIPVELVSEGKL